jgi:hypothetical protein
VFGSQLTSASCGCGCSTPDCIQARYYVGSIASAALPSSPSVGDAANIAAWLNNPSNNPCPGWPVGNAGWESGWTANWDTITDADPDPSTILSDCAGGQLPTGSSFAAQSNYVIVENGSGNATAEYASYSEFLISASIAYIVGYWCDSETNTQYYQQSCVMTGTAVGACYQYLVPVPPSSLCIPSTSNVCAAAAYFLIPASDPGGWFGQTWSGFVSGCGSGGLAAPCAGSLSLTPGPCMSGDPFFGDDP